ncbi:hypothetical protein B7P43_G17038 [Cryptotermes secundus]|uniref:Endonuclease/exonuclease/phosphatase domain-containing protein n=1 Tax=Cryptotermes secundus TaxID=105785 RepID=A0A2J7PYE6_9NEOP|nr:hypothetical protein B7P43_G17038 [Cryptotermes secundus]
MFLEEMSCRCYNKKKCEDQKEHHGYKIGTWNVRTLNQAGKLENLKTEMQKNKVSVKDVKTLPGADIDSDHNLLVAKIRTRLKKIIRLQKRRPRWDLEKLFAQTQIVQETLEEKLSAIERESGNAEVQRNNMKNACYILLANWLVKMRR